MMLLDEWIAKAEEDYASAVDLSRRRRSPVPGAVCFHCQQCAEKYLKAYLPAQGERPPMTHDLLQLLADSSALDASLAGLRAEAQRLNPFAVEIRYPGLAATDVDARDALAAVRRVRRALRRKLGL